MGAVHRVAVSHSLNLCLLIVIMLSYYQVSQCSVAYKISTLKLASMRIGIAKSQLREPGGAVTMLQEVCPAEMLAVQEGLAMSQVKVVDNPDHARKELLGVKGYLEGCTEKIGKDLSSEVRNLLTKVGQSIKSAHNLIDQSVAEPPEVFTRETQDDGGMHRSYNETFATMADTDVDEISLQQSAISTGVESQDAANQHWGPSGTLTQLLPLAPTVSIMMKDMIIDYCPNHIDCEGYAATIRLDRGCGGKFHTQSKYSSGVFTARMRAPTDATGVSNSFYVSSNDKEPDMISFDLIGNLPNRVLTAYAVNGIHAGTLETFHMDFDTSLDFHEYTIKWDGESIIWMVDNIVLRSLRSHRVHAYPKKPGQIFGYSWDASYVAGGIWAGRINWEKGPFSMHYNDLQITSPLNTKQWRPPARKQILRNVPLPVGPVVIDYGASNIEIQNQLKSLDITFDNFGCGGRFRSLNSYSSGKFRAKLKCSEGDTSGLLTSMYISSGEGKTDQDEVDFEFLGDNKRIVQTNFYVNGTAGNEYFVDLDFDCSQDFHTYAIHYSKHRLQWFVDSELVRTVYRKHQVENHEPYPLKKVFLYASIWNASAVDDGMWTGKWHGADLPFVVKYRDVTIQIP